MTTLQRKEYTRRHTAGLVAGESLGRRYAGGESVRLRSSECAAVTAQDALDSNLLSNYE